LPGVVMGDSSQDTISLGQFEIPGNLMKCLFVEDKFFIFNYFYYLSIEIISSSSTRAISL